MESESISGKSVQDVEHGWTIVGFISSKSGKNREVMIERDGKYIHTTVTARTFVAMQMLGFFVYYEAGDPKVFVKTPEKDPYALPEDPYIAYRKYVGFTKEVFEDDE